MLKCLDMKYTLAYNFEMHNKNVSMNGGMAKLLTYDKTNTAKY